MISWYPLSEFPVNQGLNNVYAYLQSPASYAGMSLSYPPLLPAASVQDTPSLAKYHSQRYRLFSKFDQGVQLDHGELSKITIYGYIEVLRPD